MTLNKTLFLFFIGFLLFGLVSLLNGNREFSRDLSPPQAMASVPERSIGQNQLPLARKEVPAPQIELLQNCTVIEGEIKPGDTLSKSLARHHIPDQAKLQIIDSLSSCLDLRKLRPGDTYSVIINDTDGLVRCSYECSPMKKYTIQEKDGLYIAKKDSVSLEIKTILFQGTLESSLFNVFLQQKEKPSLLYGFADIFSSKIDFNTEPRQGDLIEAIIEKFYQDNHFIGYGKILYARYEQISGVVHEGYYYSSEKTPGSHFDSEGKEVGTSFLKSPLPVGRLSSKFSLRRKHPILGIVRPHLGIDLAAPVGTSIMAAADGKVEFRGTRGGFGKQIILAHGNGYMTYYGHLSRYAKGLRNGSRVKQKQIIGYVGSTGLSTGPHLDYRISEQGIFKNPLAMKFKSKTVLKDGELTSFQKNRQNLTARSGQADQTPILEVRQILLKSEDSIALL